MTSAVDILSFDGCPNAEPARELVRRVAGELGIKPEIRLVEVSSPEEAERLRFLGSPSIRVDGHDVEPGAEGRGDYALSCRIYRTDGGERGQPDETWLREALRAAAQRR